MNNIIVQYSFIKKILKIKIKFNKLINVFYLITYIKNGKKS